MSVKDHLQRYILAVVLVSGTGNMAFGQTAANTKTRGVEGVMSATLDERQNAYADMESTRREMVAILSESISELKDKPLHAIYNGRVLCGHPRNESLPRAMPAQKVTHGLDCSRLTPYNHRSES